MRVCMLLVSKVGLVRCRPLVNDLRLQDDARLLAHLGCRRLNSAITQQFDPFLFRPFLQGSFGHLHAKLGASVLLCVHAWLNNH